MCTQSTSTFMPAKIHRICVIWQLGSVASISMVSTFSKHASMETKSVNQTINQHFVNTQPVSHLKCSQKRIYHSVLRDIVNPKLPPHLFELPSFPSYPSPSYTNDHAATHTHATHRLSGLLCLHAPAWSRRILNYYFFYRL